MQSDAPGHTSEAPMAIPDYETLMLPILRYAAGGERPLQEVRKAVADELGIPEEDRQTLLPSGRAPVLNDRIHWAATYLVQAGF